MLSDLRLETGMVVVGARALGGFKHMSAHCARVWSTSRHNVQNRANGQCHARAWSMLAVPGARCSIAEMGLQQLVGEMLYHNLASLLLHGVRLPL